MRKIAAILAVTGSACSSLQVQHAPTRSVVSETSPRHVRVRLASGQQVEMFEARLSGDSLVGFTRPSRDSRSQQLSVATADVREIAVEKFSAVKTVLAVGVVVAAVAIIAGGVGGGSQTADTGQGCAPAAVAPASPA